MKLTITKQIQERFRTIPGQAQYFPDDLNVNDYKIIGYLVGQRVDRLKGMTIDLFDQLRFVSYSSNAKNRREFIHVEGFRKSEKKYTILVMQLITKSK